MKGNEVIDGGVYSSSSPFQNQMRAAPARKRETLANQYSGMKGRRETFLSRAKMLTKLTLPSLFTESPSSGDEGQAYTQNGWQSLGAQGHNHLANKLTMTWFPPQRSFFRLSFTDEVKKDLYAEGIKETDLMQQLSSAEQRCKLYHEEIQGQLAWTQASKHLIGAGNAMIYAPTNDNLVCYPMDRYVVKRSKTGKVLKMILEEEKAVMEFPPNVQAIIKAKRPGTKDHETRPVYTCMKWDDESGKYLITQEVEDTLVGKEYKVSEENNPFIILVWERLYGEDYGRGMLEAIGGDLFVYQFLSKAIAKGCALMSEVKFLVRRGSATTPQQHAAAESGEYIYGEEGDISVVQLDKYADYQTVSSVMEVYARRIGQAFLMSSATRRDAERVTTVEIRQDAMELETTLGGTYSQIAAAGQLPYARLLLKRTKFKLTASDVMPIIVTGLEALGKAGELDKLAQFSEMMSVPNGWSPAAQDRIKWSDYMVMIAANLNMETPWLMTEEEYAQMQQARAQQQQQQQLMEAAGKAAPQMIKE
ncbi:portal protein [Pantoea phage Nufs112]|nr:portal protein [Pantoea phage Nufs112]